MITLNLSDWVSYLVLGVPVEVCVIVFSLWLSSRSHDNLKKLGLRDGTQINIITKKAGIPVLNISMYGNTIWDALTNSVKGLFGMKKSSALPNEPSQSRSLATEVRETIKENMVGLVKDEINEMFAGDEFRKSVQSKISTVTRKLVEEAIDSELEIGDSGADAKG